MEFYTRPSFFILLAIAIVPAAILGFAGKRIKPYGITASLFFLGLLFSNSPSELGAFLLFLLVSSASAYATLRAKRLSKNEQLTFRLSLAVTIAPLVIYKIAAVFDENLLGFLGISYITFKSVQVLIEIHDGLITELNPINYLYFLIFFAPFTSGPVDRSKRFNEDANRTFSKEEYADMFARGLMLLLIGAVYKTVIASILYTGYTPTPLEDGLSGIAGAIKDSYMYGFYLFFDFAGYSLMAMGAGYCFGIKVPRNFNAPFLALDVKDFWNRWHISLSTWLRDFVFMRFVRWSMRHKVFPSRLQTACCGYLINFIIMGAWHGLTIDYLIYGLYYGVLMGLTDVYQKKSSFHKKHRKKRWYKALQWAVTINLVMIGMSIFSGQMHLIIGGIIHG